VLKGVTVKNMNSSAKLRKSLDGITASLDGKTRLRAAFHSGRHSEGANVETCAAVAR
jgi:hypothetical protein